MSINAADVYKVVADYQTFNSQHRWTRLNTVLVANTILILSWAQMFTRGPSTVPGALAMTFLCLVGVLLGISWSILGSRGSKYVDLNFEFAKELEKEIPYGLPKIFNKMDGLRKKLEHSRWGWLSSSKNIVTRLPLVFSALFFALLILSWKEILWPIISRWAGSNEWIILLNGLFAKEISIPIPYLALWGMGMLTFLLPILLIRSIRHRADKKKR